MRALGVGVLVVLAFATVQLCHQAEGAPSSLNLITKTTTKTPRTTTKKRPIILLAEPVAPTVSADENKNTTANTTATTTTVATTANTTSNYSTTTTSSNVTTTPSNVTTTPSNHTTVSEKPTHAAPTATGKTTPAAASTSNPRPGPKPQPRDKDNDDQKFDGLSFFGGMVLVAGLAVIGFLGYRIYVRRSRQGYNAM